MGIDIVFVSDTILLEEISSSQFKELSRRVEALLKGEYAWIEPIWKFDLKESEIKLKDNSMGSTSLWVVPHLLLILREAEAMEFPLNDEDLIFTSDFHIGTIRYHPSEDTDALTISLVPRNVDGDNSGYAIANISFEEIDNLKSMNEFFESIEWRALVPGRRIGHGNF